MVWGLKYLDVVCFTLSKLGVLLRDWQESFSAFIDYDG